MSLKNAAGESIISYCIFDSDYHTDQEISERYADAAAHNIQLHIWKMKEIENYLLVPKAIARLISDGASNPKVIPSPEDVEKAVDKIADDMKDVIFDALSHEYISHDRAGGVPAANKRARTRLEEAWKTRDGRWGIIPGKDTISRLSEWAKSSFGASFGPVRIARALRPEEISIEFRGVIRAIERAQSFPTNLRKSE